MNEPGDITRLLRAATDGDPEAESRLAEIVFPELLRLARRQMNREGPGHTLQPTALVNEAYIKLTANSADWQNRSHFFAVAATMMRRILVDHARQKRAAKRTGGRVRVELPEGVGIVDHRIEEVLQVDAALDKLAAIEPRQSKIVEMRFFSGMTEEEIADVMGLSVRTVKRDWIQARAWLYAEIVGGQPRT